MISDGGRREGRPSYEPTRLPEFVPDREAILYGLRKFGIDAPQSVGVKRETVERLIDGSTRRPTASLMMQLARLFDCEVEDLDYELMGEEFASISCSQLLAWVFDALAEREELRDELAYLRRGE